MSAREKAEPAQKRLGRPPRGTEGEVTLRILAAAKPIFLQDGFAATSVDAIAGSAGISKKTIYGRFASKEDLFQAVIVRYIEENMPLLEQAALREGAIAERLYGIARAALDVILTADSIAVRRIVVAEVPRFPEFGHLLHDFGIARAAMLIERCIEDGNASGEIAVDNVKQAADFFYSIAIRSVTDRAELGLERPGLSHVKLAALKQAVAFFLKAYRPD